MLRPPSRSRAIFRKPTTVGSSWLRAVSESDHHSPSTGPRRPLAIDRLAELLVDRANLRRAGSRVVADGGQPEQVARQLRAGAAAGAARTVGTDWGGRLRSSGIRSPVVSHHPAPM